MSLTDLQLRKLKPAAKKYLLADGNGLFVRVSPKGNITWITRDRSSGKDIWVTLGRYPTLSLAEARVKAQSSKTGATALTVEKAFESYYDYIKKSYKDPGQVQRMFDTDVLPTLGEIPLAACSKAQIMSTIQKVIDRGSPVMANRVFVQVKAMFTYHEHQGNIEHNPIATVTRKYVGGKEKPKDRALSWGEISAFYTMLKSTQHNMSAGTRIALRLILATGLRASEALWLMTNKVFIIPVEVTKTETPLNIPPDKAVSMLLDEKVDIPKDHRVLSHALLRVNTEITPTFTPHDLRRTFATRMSDLGVMPHVVEKMLNHKMVGVMAVYNHAEYWPERVAAQRKWSAKLSRLWKQAKKKPPQGGAERGL